MTDVHRQWLLSPHSTKKAKQKLSAVDISAALCRHRAEEGEVIDAAAGWAKENNVGVVKEVNERIAKLIDCLLLITTSANELTNFPSTTRAIRASIYARNTISYSTTTI